MATQRAGKGLEGFGAGSNTLSLGTQGHDHKAWRL